MILAIVGLPGAGKSEAAVFLAQKTNWPKVHFGDITAEGLKEQGLPISEENERKFREDMRKKHGMAAYATLNLPKIEQLHRTSSVLVESLYSWEEYVEMKKKFGNDFKVLAMLSSPEIRRQRLTTRPIRPLTPAEFESRDAAQIENLHQAGPVTRADFFVVNEGSKEQLYGQLENILSVLQK